MHVLVWQWWQLCNAWHTDWRVRPPADGETQGPSAAANAKSNCDVSKRGADQSILEQLGSESQWSRTLTSSNPAEPWPDGAGSGEVAAVPVHKTTIGTAAMLASLGIRNGIGEHHESIYTMSKLLRKGSLSDLHICTLTRQVCLRSAT